MRKLLKCKYCGLEKETTGFGMSFHENRCKDNPNRVKHNWINKQHSNESIIKIGKHNRMGLKNPNSILDLSKRTITKVLNRLNCGCSICGWNEATCDIHHIISRKKGGLDNNDNLCILCPNCHRKVHCGKIKSETLVNITDYIGDKWKEYYYGFNGSVTGEATGMTVNHLSNDTQDASA